MRHADQYNETDKLTWRQRFVEIIELLCKRKPPDQLVNEWLERESDSLQDWIGNEQSPWWLQNIAVIDMAEIAANEAIEGRQDIIDYDNPY